MLPRRPVLLGLAALLARPARADPAVWRDLASGGAIVAIRHGRTSGGAGDPPNFSLDDCATQRALTEQGRQESVALGERFRANKVAVDLVLSSQWCRCLDTARLAFGRAEPWPALNNVFGNSSREPVQNAEVRKRIRAWTGPGTLVLVSHGSIISPLTGAYPAEGEVIVLRPDPEKSLRVAGRIGLSD